MTLDKSFSLSRFKQEIKENIYVSGLIVKIMWYSTCEVWLHRANNKTKNKTTSDSFTRPTVCQAVTKWCHFLHLSSHYFFLFSFLFPLFFPPALSLFLGSLLLVSDSPLSCLSLPGTPGQMLISLGMEFTDYYQHYSRNPLCSWEMVSLSPLPPSSGPQFPSNPVLLVWWQMRWMCC